MTWQFDHLKMFGYDVILLDPPWRFELYNEETGGDKSAVAHYQTMSTEDIAALRVGELARGDALVLLYGLECMRQQAHDCLDSWGVIYKSAMVWRKTTRNKKVRMGPGYRVRTMHEPLLLGTIGNPKHIAFPSIFDGLARRHSQKPEEGYKLIEKHTPGAARADLFSRKNRPGWDSWGNETGKFDGGDDAVTKRQKTVRQPVIQEGTSALPLFM